MSKRPTVLMILDGYGLNDSKKGNAVAEAKTPVVDQLMKEEGLGSASSPEQPRLEL